MDQELAPINDIGDQSEEERKLVAHVRSQVEEIRSSASRIAWEGIAMTNIAYLCGYDGVAFNNMTRQFQPINRGSPFLKKNRLHVNTILPTIQNRLARLCKNPPKYDVRPESNSTEDKDAARLSLQILQSSWDKLGLDQKRLFLYMWVQQAGYAWMKVSWDETMGNPMVDPLSNEMDYEGDVRAEVVSPFEVFPDPMAKTEEDVLRSWLIQAKVRKLDYFKAHYPGRGESVKEEGAWLLSAQYEQRINSFNTRGPAQGGMQDALKHSAIEIIKYEARSKKYPNGRMIITANGVLLSNKELPVGEIPFRKFDDIIIGGKFASEAVITHLRPVQDSYNENERRIDSWMRKFIAGKYHAFRGSGLSVEAMNDESGELVQTDLMPSAPEGGKPTAIQVPALPQWAFQFREVLKEEINNISGISEVSRGTLPSASIPAIGMQLLTEQDDTRIGVMTEQHEHSWAGVGSLILKYVQMGYKLPRKLKIAGPSLEYTVKEVSGDMIKNNTDVIVIRGSTLPGSKTLNRQEILNAYDKGLLGDPTDPKVREKVLGLIEFGDTTGLWEDYGLDESQIKKGIDQLEQGIPVQVDELDNHIMWILKLNRYRKGDKFGALSPDKQQLIRETMEAHLQAQLKVTNAVPPVDEQGRPLNQPLIPEDMMEDQPMQQEAPPNLTGLEAQGT